MTMDAALLEAQFRSRVCEGMRLASEGLNRFRVFTPFLFDDGDHLSIVLKQRGDSWVFSDEGHTYMHLTYRLDEKTLGTGTRQRIINDAIAAFGLTDNDGELMIAVPDLLFGDALYSFIQGLLRISDVSLLSRERVQSTFMEDFKQFMGSTLVPGTWQLNWHHPKLDPQGIYPADLYVNGSANTVIFALPNDAKVRDATIALLKFEQWQLSVRSVGIFEAQEEISRNVLARFSDVCEKQFSTLTANRARIAVYLQHLGAQVRLPAGN